MKRRTILQAGAAAAAGLGFPAIVRAQPSEIVMLGLWDQTGAFADVGPLNDRGMRMALEERGMKVLGRPIKYITRDGATQAGTSTRRVEEAADGDGAKFIVGPWSSGVALTERLLRPGNTVLRDLGIDLEALQSARRPLFRCCTDWTERRPHVAGALGAALLRRYKDERWLVAVEDSRKLVVTPQGRSAFVRLFDLDPVFLQHGG